MDSTGMWFLRQQVIVMSKSGCNWHDISAVRCCCMSGYHGNGMHRSIRLCKGMRCRALSRTHESVGPLGGPVVGPLRKQRHRQGVVLAVVGFLLCVYSKLTSTKYRWDASPCCTGLIPQTLDAVE